MFADAKPQEALRFLPRRRKGEHLQVIGIANFKGGSAKTTTSVHLCHFLALHGYRVLAVDLDPQASLSAMFGAQPEMDVGENETINVDVRIVCATNRNLQDMVSEGSFREDLFFRVNTFEIRLPPLRERKEDIPALARTLVARHMKRPEVPEGILAPETVSLLRAHEWPGNVRELANAIEHAVILSDGKVIRPEDLPRSIIRKPTVATTAPTTSAASVAVVSSEPKTLREMEEEMILRVLDKYSGDKPKAAKELGIALKTLYNRLSQMEQQRHAG
jgi:DNA-binding NtrC family response regulator